MTDSRAVKQFEREMSNVGMLDLTPILAIVIA